MNSWLLKCFIGTIIIENFYFINFPMQDFFYYTCLIISTEALI